jgi:hypothetical protein
VSAQEGKDLKRIQSKIEKQNESCSCSWLVTSIEDESTYSVNYYIEGGTFKRFLKQPDWKESKRKWGDKRRWLVSNLKAKDLSIYFSGDYNDEYGKILNLKDLYKFAFKNYCEFDGKVDPSYARIKKLRLTFYEAAYHAADNMTRIKIDEPFRKTKILEISIKEDDKIISPSLDYPPLGTKTREGSIFAMRLTVLDTFPGEAGKGLCVSDFYLGRKKLPYEELLKQID